jgi:beta-phosphoglucomutase-like phosphatase (HAD superfamily)
MRPMWTGCIKPSCPCKSPSIRDHAQLIPGCRETIAALRERGIRIGANTGYSREMMEPLVRAAAEQGYARTARCAPPKCRVAGRYPYMSLKNAIELGVETVQACVKVDDTVPGIEEGLNAGCGRSAVAISGNEIGLPLADWDGLSAAEQGRRRERAYGRRLLGGGAHYVIDSIADLPRCLDAIEARLGARRAAVNRQTTLTVPPPGESEINATPAANRLASIIWTKRVAAYWLRTPVIFCGSRFPRPVWRRSAAPKAAGSRIPPDAAIWIFTATAFITSATAIPACWRRSRQQLDELSFAPRRFTCEPAVDLARRLIEISPPGLDKVLFATGGSDAVEIALKIARAATGRFKTLSFWDAFHGAGFRRGQRRRRGAVPLRPHRAAAGRNRACAALRLLPLSLRLSG